MDINQQKMAKRMINASICAYQMHPTGWVEDPYEQYPPVERTIKAKDGKSFYNVVPTYQDEVGFVDTAANGYAPLWHATGKDQIDAVLVGAMKDGNLLISFRGTIPPSFDNNDITSWVSDWLGNTEIGPRSWWVKKLPYIKDCKVATGFAKPMLKLWPQIVQMIDTTLESHPCTGVIITGHSKGAALTFLAATLVEAAYPQFQNKIHVHAFAPPVVGNATFEKFYGSLSATTHRYQVQNDIVPFLPLWADANVFPLITFDKSWEEAVWAAIVIGVDLYVEGGYYAVGDYTYFDSTHTLVPGAVVQTSAMPAVAHTMRNDPKLVPKAHSAVHSYLPCFN